MTPSSRRVALLAYVGCSVVVAAACSSGGPGLLDGGLFDPDAGLDGLLPGHDGGLDATVSGSRDGSSDARTTLDGSDANATDGSNLNDAGDASDGSVAVMCNDA